MNEATKPVPCAPKEIKLTPADEKRFWAKVNKDGPTMPHMDSPCWEWIDFKSRGYGRMSVKKRKILAHRIAWSIHNGAIPNHNSHHGICVCHKCDVRHCVNPSHLFLGTNADNAMDKTIKNRGNQPSGDKNGARLHPERMPKGERHGCAKLSAFKVIEIRSRYAIGDVTMRELAKQFRVSYGLIGFIINRRLWKHLP